MTAFGAGTVPALSLAAVGLRRFMLTSLVRRRIFALLVLLTGLWAIWVRITPRATAGPHQHPPPSPSASDRQ
jgi:sulfite exporter TauE/SafE